MAPVASVPGEVTLEKGQAVEIVGEFSDSNSTDSLSVEIRGLPPGLHAVPGEQFDGRRQMRLYGSLGGAISDDAIYELTWSASDGSTTQLAHTIVHAKARVLSPSELEEAVVLLLTTRYAHGLPPPHARALGSPALPILCRMLRDEQYRPKWPKIVQAIGNIGDTAYFDTLHAFIWKRFHGPIDRRTFATIEIAQNNLYPIASVMPRALDYLISMSTNAAWNSVPWSVPDYAPSAVATYMTRHTLSAIGLTDSDRVRELIDALPLPAETQSLGGSYHAAFVRDIQATYARVRMKGFIRIWEENWGGDED